MEEYTDRSLLLGTKTEIARDYEFTAEGIEFKLCMHYDMEVEKKGQFLALHYRCAWDGFDRNTDSG